MATMIAVYKGDGRCVGRCDAKCYDARHNDCHCICGGKNHGKGVEAAGVNVRAWVQNALREDGEYGDNPLVVTEYKGEPVGIVTEGRDYLDEDGWEFLKGWIKKQRSAARRGGGAP